MRNILVSGGCNVQAERFVNAADNIFSSPRFITYFIEKKADKSKSVVQEYDVLREIYDYNLQKEAPRMPDTEYLTNFEEEFGVGVLWRSVKGDSRITQTGSRQTFYDDKPVFDHREILANLEIRIKTLRELFDEFDVDLMFASSPNLGSLLAAVICEQREIPYYSIGHTHIEGLHVPERGDFTLFERTFHSYPLADAYENIRSSPENNKISDAVDFIKQVRGGKPLYTISQVQPENKQNKEKPVPESTIIDSMRKIINITTLPFQYISKLAKFMLYTSKYTARGHYTNVSLLKNFYEQRLQKVRTWYMNSIYEFSIFDPDEKYVYFPLQSQPETALMQRGRLYTEQDTVVKHVAQCLPVGVELYVNDHPDMEGVRWPSFYDRVNRLPNVRLLSGDIETKEIIKNAKATICINTTVGLESAIHETPVITLANPDYTLIDGVTPVSGYDDIPEIINKIIENGVDMESVASYIAASRKIGKKKNDFELYKHLCERIQEDSMSIGSEKPNQ